MNYRMAMAILLLVGAAPVAEAGGPTTTPTARPESLAKHEKYKTRMQAGNIQILFLGDSLTERLAGTPVWRQQLQPLGAVGFGIGSERTQHLLWRLQNGELDGPPPPLVVLLIGTNNLGINPDTDIADGVRACVEEIRQRWPGTKILLLGLFPKGELPDTSLRIQITDINSRLSNYAAQSGISYLDLKYQFVDTDEKMLATRMLPDHIHPTEEGYEAWVKTMLPVIKNMLSGH